MSFSPFAELIRSLTKQSRHFLHHSWNIVGNNLVPIVTDIFCGIFKSLCHFNKLSRTIVNGTHKVSPCLFVL